MNSRRNTTRTRQARAALAAGSACLAALLVSACSRPSEVASFRRERQFTTGDPLAMIGLRARKQERIDYDPRSPLVMPPAPDLQSPKETADLGTQWPDDPDARRAAEEEARQEYLRTEAHKVDRTRALKPNELADWGREAGMVDADPNDKPQSGTRSVRLLSPAELLRGRREKPDPTAEPARRTLTEPPEGYRKAVTDENGQVNMGEDEKPKRRGFLSRLGF